MFGAVMMGLGSIIGTGVFVSLGVAAGVTGPSVLLAIGIGALVASFNGLSSAQLAANHPVSGGTYEYGYEYLTPRLGFLAGWAFLLAKSASAATAALGFAGYALDLVGANVGGLPQTLIGVGLVVVLTGLVLAGMRRSNLANIVIVSVTLASLAAFVVAGLPAAVQGSAANFTPFFRPESGAPLPALLYASALMFVAFTGYGRIATLGEEVKRPLRTIPRAVVAALVTVMVLYLLVAFVGVGAGGIGADIADAQASGALATGTFAAGAPVTAGEVTAPLVAVARGFENSLIAPVVALGAVTAMIGVLLNLLLGLSRVLLAMGRRRDMPAVFARLDRSGSTPTAAVVAVGVIIAALVLVGDVRLTWSFSAFTVLVYYSLTNLAALRLPAGKRLYPAWIAGAGLGSCLLLAVFVEPLVLLAGVLALLVGVVWQVAATALAGSTGR